MTGPLDGRRLKLLATGLAALGLAVGIWLLEPESWLVANLTNRLGAASTEPLLLWSSLSAGTGGLWLIQDAIRG